MNRFSWVLTAAAIAAGLGMSDGAQAATATKNYFQNATGFCQPALPVFDTNVRKRPTAVANEGTSNAFVSCSMVTSAEESTGISRIDLVLYNRAVAPLNVTCSLVHSYEAGGLIVPKTVAIPAGARGFLVWTTADVGNPASIAFANFSCDLPAGVEIGYAFYRYSYEIGA